MTTGGIHLLNGAAGLEQVPELEAVLNHEVVKVPPGIDRALFEKLTSRQQIRNSINQTTSQLDDGIAIDIHVSVVDIRWLVG